MRILMVDDNEGIIEALKEIIELLLPDSRVTVARDGEEGLKILKEKEFDILFSDVNMPKKGGIEMIMDANKSGAAPKNIIIMTAADPEWFKRNEPFLKALGIKGFLEKPFPAKQIKEILEQL